MTDSPDFSGGLVPCIVQDATTREILMLGYQDQEAWNATQSSDLVHFHSRSRDALWRKGETSGNALAVVAVALDCDLDAILITAIPVGPTCHTGAVSCFGITADDSLGVAIDRLTNTIAERRSASTAESYTARLLADLDLAARKVLEEAGELAFAAKDTASGEPDQRVVEEAADLIYHSLALLAQQAIDPSRVADELTARSG